MPARHRDRTDRSIGPIGRLRSDVSDRTSRSDRSRRDPYPFLPFTTRPNRPKNLPARTNERTNDLRTRMKKLKKIHHATCPTVRIAGRGIGIGTSRAGSGHRDLGVSRVRTRHIRGGYGIFSSGSIHRIHRFDSGAFGRDRDRAWIFSTARAPVESRAESERSSVRAFERRSIWREKAFEHSGRP